MPPATSSRPTQSRRTFLTGVAAGASLGLGLGFGLGLGLTGCVSAPGRGGGFIDTHTHFYDPTRPQGVPWPGPEDEVLFRPVYPAEFLQLANPLGVTGTVVVEASPWVEDNQWVLELAAREKSILGVVGRLQPGQPGFKGELERFAANPLYRGIRIGAWEKDRNGLAGQPELVRDLRLLAARDLSLDLLLGPDQLSQASQLAAAVPDLRIVVNHCANVRVDGAPPPARWRAGLGECARFRNVFMKVSGLVEGTGRARRDAPTLPALYQPVLDAVWNEFGRDRVLFGSNWPVSARFASYATVFQIVHDYFNGRGPEAAARCFRGNAMRIYGLDRHPR